MRHMHEYPGWRMCMNYIMPVLIDYAGLFQKKVSFKKNHSRPLKFRIFSRLQMPSRSTDARAGEKSGSGKLKKKTAPTWSLKISGRGCSHLKGASTSFTQGKRWNVPESADGFDVTYFIASWFAPSAMEEIPLLVCVLAVERVLLKTAPADPSSRKSDKITGCDQSADSHLTYGLDVLLRNDARGADVESPRHGIRICRDEDHARCHRAL